MIQTYQKALAPGTYLNRAKQARSYITFSVLYNVPYLSPLPVHVCMFSQYLANKFHSISSVKNYLSGARTWVVEHGGSPLAFTTYEQSMMVKALTKDSSHVVKRAFPLLLQHLHKIVSYLDKSRNVPPCIKPCILIGYSCYLRSSNLLAPSFTVVGGPHTLLARNVIDCGEGLKVIVNSTKSTAKPYVLFVPVSQVPEMCPVRAWRLYKNSQHFHPYGPAFVINKINSLNQSLLVNLMRDALSGDPNIDVTQISMHSLRRGAAQQANLAGASLSDIMARGAWASKSGVKPYLTQ